jgi:hypothetical protein
VSYVDVFGKVTPQIPVWLLVILPFIAECGCPGLMKRHIIFLPLHTHFLAHIACEYYHYHQFENENVMQSLAASLLPDGVDCFCDWRVVLQRLCKLSRHQIGKMCGNSYQHVPV